MWSSDDGELSCDIVTAEPDKPVAEAGLSDRAERAMTIEEFLSWQTRQERLFELVDGRPRAVTGAKLRHDRVTGNAYGEIRRQLRHAGNPCDAFTDDIGIRTARGNIRRPDVSVLYPPFEEDAMISDRPRLVVEVLSESTMDMDRLVKLEEHEAIAALNYIVIIDPRQIEVGFWARDDARVWRSTIAADRKAVLEMPGLGLSLGLAALYERVTVAPRPGPRLVWDDDGA
ncbi:MAG: Uma2 family endonuclease [Proteobacteria bacterium]|nr:Uma2 family endonuclease [Pseudomonadota bacterium]